jgi:hypothetical protein
MQIPALQSAIGDVRPAGDGGAIGSISGNPNFRRATTEIGLSGSSGLNGLALSGRPKGAFRLANLHTGAV